MGCGGAGVAVLWQCAPVDGPLQELSLLLTPAHEGRALAFVRNVPVLQVLGDAQNHLRLLGAADDLLLAGTDPHKLQQARLAVFVRDPQALARYLPVVRAWAAADVLGFNQDCPGKDQARCQAAAKLPLPIQAYNLNCKASNGKIIQQHCALPLPQVPDDVSPGLFWQ